MPPRTEQSAVGHLELLLDRPGAIIHRNIYGHFAEHLGRCIYEGIWVGEDSQIPNTRGLRNDVVAALKRLDVPVLRWPGGCFADEYHWKDGVGPRASRPRRINTHWGGVVENNHFGTHEFMDLCEQLGAQAYVCGNLGSGTVQEMMEWVEYMTSDADTPLTSLRRAHGRERPWTLHHFGVGNESWGCGGHMRAEYYADNYRRYATFVKSFPGQRVRRIACGAAGDDLEWTETLMSRACRHMDGLSLHWYSLPTGDWARKGSSTEFSESEWFSTLKQALHIERLLETHSAIMDRHDPEYRVGLVVDEWGTWYDVEPGTKPGFLYQQNTLRDALVAAVTLNAFHRHARRVSMANIAQMVNVLQSMVLTDADRMLLTPSYHVFEMYKVHQGATSIPLEFASPPYEHGAGALPMLHASASRSTEGAVHVSLVNLDPNRQLAVSVTPLQGAVSGRVLTAPTMNAHNTFERPTAVEPAAFTEFSARESVLKVRLPARSIVVLAIE